MGMITQTGNRTGAILSGIGTYQAYGQAVFSIGWKYVFAAMTTSQLTGTLIETSTTSGVPVRVVLTNHSIVDTTFPSANSWNNGNAIHVTTVDAVQYMYLRYDGWNSKNVYRGTWDDTKKQFSNFSVFSTMTSDIGGFNYSAMAKLNNNKMRIISDAEWIYEFDVRTGEAVAGRNVAVAGTWSPSSYPFANAFVPTANQEFIIGASGNGTNWYQQYGTSTPAVFDPTVSNSWADGFNSIVVGHSHFIHPSTHHNVSYYTPNDGTIAAYINSGVYIQTQSAPSALKSIPKIFMATLEANVAFPVTKGNLYFEYGTTTGYGTIVEAKPKVGAPTVMTAQIGGLNPSTAYHYRAYVLYSDGTKAASGNSTVVTKSGLAIVATDLPTDIGPVSATLNARIVSYDQ